MPILHHQYSGQTQAPDGSTFPVPPNLILGQRGPLIQVVLSVAQVIAQQLQQQGSPLPAPVPGIALIDTGASVTCVDESVAQQLQLPVIDVVQISSASHATAQQNVYPLHIEVVGINMQIEAQRAVGAPLATQGIQVLIGRDILQHCILIYNGPVGQITFII